MGILYIVGTPIGNLEDITIRAIRTLFTVDYVACEDTRHTGQLLANLELNIKNQELAIKDLIINKPKLISYYDEIEFKRVPEIIELLQNDKNVALVSDSGTPLISDPGYKLVQECIKKDIRIISIPGATSLITALTSSGLPPNDFLFLGYLPPKETSRKKLLVALFSLYSSNAVRSSRSARTIINPTIIFFESPHRLKQTLIDLKEVFGDIDIVICRELTKIHEEMWRGNITETSNQLNLFKGEIVLLFKIPQA